MRVRLGVVHDLLPRRGKRLHALRVFFHPLADEEERGAHIVGGEDVDERLRVLIAPGGVEREGDALFLTPDAVDRQLPARDGRADNLRLMHRPEHQRRARDERCAGEDAPQTERNGFHIHAPPEIVGTGYAEPHRIMPR